jgi:hypothetical protein
MKIQKRLKYLILLTIPLVIVAFGISGCAFLDGLLEEVFGADSTHYTLSIDYDYQGSVTISGGSPIIFWVMPLDKNDEVMVDPDDPDGPPKRKEYYSSMSTGTISCGLQGGKYGVLAFVDENGDGSINLMEYYVLYDGAAIADSWWEKIYLNNNQQIDMWFDDSYEWHAVFIRYPLEGQQVFGNFWSDGGFISDQISDIVVYLDGSNQGYANIFYDDDYWNFYVDVRSLEPGKNYTLTAVAKDMYSNPFDSYSVNFYLIGY